MHAIQVDLPALDSKLVKIGAHQLGIKMELKDKSLMIRSHLTAISALQSVLQEDFKASEIEVGVVRKDDPVFKD